MHDDELSPDIQAEMAATRFEEAENDRWQRLHSFTYRHSMPFMLIGMILAASGGMTIIWINNNMASLPGMNVLVGLLALMVVGMSIMFFALVRPDEQSARAAARRSLVSVVMVVALLAGLLALVTMLT